MGTNEVTAPCDRHPDVHVTLGMECPWCTPRWAVVKICCDRANGVEYFADHCEAQTRRLQYESNSQHRCLGILLAIDDYERPPVRVGLEDHQLWVWLRTHWEVRGTGALL